MALSGKPLHIPDIPLAQFMLENFALFGNKVALIDHTTDRSLTFRELSDTVRRCARGLSSLGFKKGDVLCMFSPNVLEYPVLFYAVASLGGVFQATNPTYIASELQHTLDICESKYLVTTSGLLPTVLGTDFNQQVILLGETDTYISYFSLVSNDISTQPINVDIEPKKDTAVILFSSGTTGKPKAVQITHHAIVANVLQSLEDGGLQEDDVYVTFLPFFHIYGLVAILTVGLYRGSQNAVMSKFKPKDYLCNLQKYKASVLHLVPPVMVLFSKMADISQYDVSSVRKILCGAAPLSTKVEVNVLEIFPITHVSQGYGMTECLVTHMIQGEYRCGSVGTLMPATECKIVNPYDESILPENVDGEVCVRGPTLMKGYLRNKQATDDMFDKDGWLRTGDIGHVDSEGFLYIVDRIKELIKYKGYQVAPAELENILLSHPDVADVGVIGIPDEEAGELPKAFVVRKKASSVSEQELVEFVAGRVSVTKELRGGVEFLPEIPKSVSGKILRRILRDNERNKREESN